MNFLKLIRYQNLAMLALMQLVFRYGFLKLRGIELALSDLQYCILVLSTVCIAAGGYLINNVFDQETDSDNKPSDRVVGVSISESMAYNYYIGLNIIGVGAGFYLANVIQKPGFSAIFIIVAATLYLYASSLKQSLLIGNIIIALLLAFSVIIIGIFDLFPIITVANQPIMAVSFDVLLDFATFTFILNLIREIVKDLEDVDGDYNQGMNTLPIVLGISRSAKLIFFVSFIPIIAVFYYINRYFVATELWIATAYALFMVVGPLIYFTIKMWTARSIKDFAHLSTVLKWVLFFGILSVLVIALNIKYHA